MMFRAEPWKARVSQAEPGNQNASEFRGTILTLFGLLSQFRLACPTNAVAPHPPSSLSGLRIGHGTAEIASLIISYKFHPPATSSVAPVMKLASSEARNAMAEAISAGSAILPSGVSAIIISLNLGLMTSLMVGVSVNPGRTAFTRTPLEPHSRASDFVRPIKPAFAEQ